jgi:hypothetical protein
VTQQYIDNLTTTYPVIREVWLFGSRANGRQRLDSDWDYIVFGDDARLLHTLHLDTRFNVPNIDLFFVAAPDIAAQPWTRPGERNKILNLNHSPGNMAWTVLSATEASYIQSKDFDPPRFEVDVRTMKAVLAYRRDP